MAKARLVKRRVERPTGFFDHIEIIADGDIYNLYVASKRNVNYDEAVERAGFAGVAVDTGSTTRRKRKS